MSSLIVVVVAFAPSLDVVFHARAQTTRLRVSSPPLPLDGFPSPTSLGGEPQRQGLLGFDVHVPAPQVLPLWRHVGVPKSCILVKLIDDA